MKPCLCKCGCPDGGIVTRKECMQSINRCIPCRRSPGPDCRRIQVHEKPPMRPARLKWTRTIRPNGYVVAVEALDPRIEAQLDRLYAKRRGPKFQVGSAGASGALAIPPTVLNGREPSPPPKEQP
jgi:hypothetical protein